MTDTTETSILLTKPREKPKAIKIEIKVMSKSSKVSQVWEYLVGTGLATEEELQLVTYYEGYSMESLEKVIHSRTGLDSFEQLQEEDGNN